MIGTRDLEQDVCIRPTISKKNLYLLQFNEIDKEDRPRVTSFISDCLENFVEMVENDSLQRAVIARSKWLGQKHMWFQYKNGRTL